MDTKAERRETRRQKQREANAGRALKMRKARLVAEKEETAPAVRLEPQTYNIGCSGWFYWHWRENFYKGLPTREWFSHYADIFKTVELNAPFYSWPTLANIAAWKRQAGRRRFIYTVKVCELITHIKRFSGTRTLIKDFGFVADLLGAQMGCFLFQLPPSFHYTPARLKAIVAQLNPSQRNVVEFRHRSWWNEDAYAAFRRAGVIFCSCSGPRLPDDLVKTADDIYIRFHGRTRWYVYDYSREELEEWAQRIRASGAKHIWAYFNNDRHGNAVRNAKTLAKLLKAQR